MEGRKTRNNFEVLQWNWTYQHEIVFFFSIYDIGRNKHKCVYTCMYVRMSVCVCIYVYMCVHICVCSLNKRYDIINQWAMNIIHYCVG